MDMGRHEAPVEGVAIANGHAPALVPFAISPQLEVRQGGPMAPWPQPARPDRWRQAASVMRVAFAHRGWLAAVPVVLVNAVAFYGQLAFLRGHLAAPPGVQALVAVALESIAVYLAWQAHLAQLADDSALRLRLAAYGMAAIIGAMNYSHWAAHWRPTFAALAFALCSAISPWLWSVHSRRESRNALRASRLIEPHAVRLGMTRWMWHPLRSWHVMRHATWIGENDPAKAIALAEAAAPDGGQDGGSNDDTEHGGGPPPEDDKIPPPPPPPDPPKMTPAIAKAVAAIKRYPKLTDREAAKKAGVSERTVQRARPLAPADPQARSES